LLRSSNPSTRKLQKDRQKSNKIRIYKPITIPGRRALREETQNGGENPEEEDEEEAPAAGTENDGSREGDPRSNRDGKPHKKPRAGGRPDWRAAGTGRGRLIHRKDYCYRVFFCTGRLEIQR
jgi:hypothetical protein